MTTALLDIADLSLDDLAELDGEGVLAVVVRAALKDAEGPNVGAFNSAQLGAFNSATA